MAGHSSSPRNDDGAATAPPPKVNTTSPLPAILPADFKALATITARGPLADEIEVGRSMSQRPTLDQLRRRIVAGLGDEWTTPSELCDEFGLGHGIDWYRVALVLERLAGDGMAELQRAGSTVRRFRSATHQAEAAA